MSKGPGKWQSLILAELTEREHFYLLELLPVNYRKAEYNALSRAAWRLFQEDKIKLIRYSCGIVDQAKLLCVRPGVTVEDRPKFNQSGRRA